MKREVSSLTHAAVVGVLIAEISQKGCTSG
ncbi:hypothetical protein NBRC3277_0155 [Acetobacter pasteurianus NBRC 3277]|nr:hypothetical protein NBRC3277_0155 [Acetobacter pasteurianus NBRC 3277]